ncbi:hypothetical protein Tb927.3.5780 [Trypanosoma brucei brucei TREU927]|uniref:Uncharacterized protein n=1 Tax=Trypanosoma brucei brucei (strain 927/4 GUTat10.1) TaxID=185431 RepID=Q57VG6_TRYB2|nr:hypothetical protein Tb927.3.5780 [Trypanosoma brucei brucei TREU927]AAX70403.1 hypothetical protein Tb927.3.5780 [Trypanosoma brucei]AAZ10608.1 hypothetical protein Tb927.3.5780 [Trypanosoma brucei brucei TREU927]
MFGATADDVSKVGSGGGGGSPRTGLQTGQWSPDFRSGKTLVKHLVCLCKGKKQHRLQRSGDICCAGNNEQLSTHQLVSPKKYDKTSETYKLGVRQDMEKVYQRKVNATKRKNNPRQYEKAQSQRNTPTIPRGYEEYGLCACNGFIMDHDGICVLHQEDLIGTMRVASGGLAVSEI